MMSYSQGIQRSDHSLLVESIVKQVVSELSRGDDNRGISYHSTRTEPTENTSSLSSSERAKSVRRSKSIARGVEEPSKKKKKKKPKEKLKKEKKKVSSKSASNNKTISRIEELLLELQDLKAGEQAYSNIGNTEIPPTISVLPDSFSSLQQSRVESYGSLSSIAAASTAVGSADFYKNIAAKLAPHRNSICIQEDLETLGKNAEEEKRLRNKKTCADGDFEAAFRPEDMRCLALVSHNEMKSTMKEFVECHKHVLKKFRLTGTNSTMTMLQEVFYDEPDIVFGPTCNSGPLGGDAELVALMATGQLGGILFFQDPMTAHPHHADIECLNRQAQVHNTVIATTPTTAMTIMQVFRMALEGEGKPEFLPSFFFSLQGPSVAAYKREQMVKVNSLASISRLTDSSS